MDENPMASRPVGASRLERSWCAIPPSGPDKPQPSACRDAAPPPADLSLPPQTTRDNWPGEPAAVRTGPPRRFTEDGDGESPLRGPTPRGRAGSGRRCRCRVRLRLAFRGRCTPRLGRRRTPTTNLWTTLQPSDLRLTTLGPSFTHPERGRRPADPHLVSRRRKLDVHGYETTEVTPVERLVRTWCVFGAGQMPAIDRGAIRGPYLGARIPLASRRRTTRARWPR